MKIVMLSFSKLVEAPPLVASSSKLSVKSTSQKDQLRKKAADYKEQVMEKI